ncbi:MAG: NAD(P)H-hydrate dehydratase [Acidimicrobiaceae bacterium]|nr:NAD(P)H-hydrate dehydratase [Acidimicrobiaceae bacterium]
MIPVVTPAEMAEIDAASPEAVDVLVGRAGAAVARAVLEELGGGYGRRVVVLAGPGSNGADGRVAAERLEQRGVRTVVVDALDAPERLPPADLVVDAAFGTGLRHPFEPPRTSSPVLAVDLPSGLDGLTGVAMGAPMGAVRTVTFAALKPGLLLGEGPGLAGRVEVADIGLDVSGAGAFLVEDSDISGLVPMRRPDAHKWHSACWVVAGSPGMEGAAHLAAAAAQRAGAGYVRLSVPGGVDAGTPVEVVGHPVDVGLAEVSGDLDRFASLVVGPGLGTDGDTWSGVRRLVASSTVPVVVDGDGLNALVGGDQARRWVAPVVLTPHDGEYERLTGSRPEPDRIGAARALARSFDAVVLLKGPTTVVAAPDGRVRLVTAGDSRLATAGTGDVLAGILGAFVARGADPLDAAAAAAHVHGRLATACPETGLVAGDLATHLVEVLVGLEVDPLEGASF